MTTCRDSLYDYRPAVEEPKGKEWWRKGPSHMPKPEDIRPLPEAIFYYRYRSVFRTVCKDIIGLMCNEKVFPFKKCVTDYEQDNDGQRVVYLPPKTR